MTTARTTLLMPLGVAMAILAVLVAPAIASAHALGADCTLRDGRVEVQAYYSDSTAARQATVRVLDAADALVADGHTDDHGCWSFAAPPPGRYYVVVNAGAGHRARVRFIVPPENQAASSSASSPEEKCACCEDGSDAGADSPTQISEGPSRRDFTAIPWFKVGVGLAILAALGLGARLLLRTTRR
jgi:hypothetical protein